MTEDMFRRWFRRKRKVQLQLTIGPVFTCHRGKKQPIMATLQLTDAQKCALSIQADDAAGNPTTLPPGAVSWSSSNPSCVAVSPAADGMSADITAQGPIGTAQISVAVTVDPAQAPLTGTLDVTVVAGAAATIAILPGTPAAK